MKTLQMTLVLLVALAAGGQTLAQMNTQPTRPPQGKSVRPGDAYLLPWQRYGRAPPPERVYPRPEIAPPMERVPLSPAPMSPRIGN
jgi:hypothetical protein